MDFIDGCLRTVTNRSGLLWAAPRQVMVPHQACAEDIIWRPNKGAESPGQCVGPVPPPSTLGANDSPPRYLKFFSTGTPSSVWFFAGLSSSPGEI